MRGRLGKKAKQTGFDAAGGTTRPDGAYSAAILRDWKRIALITIAATVFAWIVASMQPPRYQATALATVAPMGEGLPRYEFIRSLDALDRPTLVTTITALASMPATRKQVAAGSDYHIEATVVRNTNLFRVSVQGSDAAQTAAIANRVTEFLSAQTRTIYKYYGVRMLATAVPPTEPVSARPTRAIAAGPVIGLLLGILSASANHWRATRRGSAT